MELSAYATVFLLSSTFLLIFLFLKSSEWLLIILLIHPFYSLAFFLSFRKSDFNASSIFFDVSLIFLLIFFAIRKKTIVFDKLTLFILINTFLALGILLAVNSPQTGIAKIIALKLLLYPFAALFLGQISLKFILRLVLALFIISIINFIFAFLQVRWGFFRFAETGVGSEQLVRFYDSRVRAPGLTPSAFYLGLLSAFQFSLSWHLVRSRIYMLKNLIRVMLSISLLLAVLNIFLSSSRTSAIFILVFVFYYEFRKSKFRFQKFFTSIIVPFTAFGTYVLLGNFAPSLVGTDSFDQRLAIWKDYLAQTNWIFGIGVGQVGSASNSSFANPNSARFVDNQYLNFFMQFGIFFVCFFLIILTIMWRKTDVFGRSLLVALGTAAIFLEVWEYTSLSFMVVLFASQKNRDALVSYQSKIDS